MEGNGAGLEIDLEEVDAFAAAAHEGQERVPGTPYVEHVRAVRAILENEFPERVDHTTLAVALLHDVLEDCDVHPTILLDRWGPEIQEGVTLLSWNLRALGIDRVPRIYWSGIRRGPRTVRLVKAADRIDNLRATLVTRDEEKREKYLDETERELLPILRESHESWLVERLEDLLGRLRAWDA